MALLQRLGARPAAALRARAQRRAASRQSPPCKPPPLAPRCLPPPALPSRPPHAVPPGRADARARVRRRRAAQDKAQRSDPNRVGGPSNPLLASGGLGTAIAKGNDAQSHACAPAHGSPAPPRRRPHGSLALRPRANPG